MNKNFILTLMVVLLSVLATLMLGGFIAINMFYPTHLDKKASATNEYLYQNITKIDDLYRESGYESVKGKIEKDMAVIRHENIQFKDNKEITDTKDKNYIAVSDEGIHFNTEKSSCLLIMRKTTVLKNKMFINGNAKESAVGEDCNRSGVFEARILFSDLKSE